MATLNPTRQQRFQKTRELIKQAIDEAEVLENELEVVFLAMSRDEKIKATTLMETLVELRHFVIECGYAYDVEVTFPPEATNE